MARLRHSGGSIHRTAAHPIGRRLVHLLVGEHALRFGRVRREAVRSLDLVRVQVVDLVRVQVQATAQGLSPVSDPVQEQVQVPGQVLAPGRSLALALVLGLALVAEGSVLGVTG